MKHVNHAGLKHDC